MDESIRKQLEKPQTWFCKYFPKRIQNVGEKEIADRQMVYDFKDGRSHEAVAQMTAARMIEEHGSRCSQLVFIPVPASSVRKNEIRYMDFCRRVCARTMTPRRRARPRVPRASPCRRFQKNSARSGTTCTSAPRPRIFR